ncbi:hypothetical protein EDD52_1421 [Primorskyibacter sedentarius]|uniref:Transposase n=1 Tax=Primorskyibacter sedentarius TaxID=745311 RepID=A0A4R3IR00_9RHOB|nr:hypothetical protein EDD52_1421 [Primorskyibacter sedentarius]
MPRKTPFKHHRFPRDIILRAIRWYLRYPLSYQDVADLLAERGITVDSKINGNRYILGRLANANLKRGRRNQRCVRY